MEKSARTPMIGRPLTTIAAMLIALGSMGLAPSVAQTGESIAPPPVAPLVVPVQDEDSTPFSDEDFEELSREAEEAAKKFVEMIGPLLQSFSELLADLPRYDPPEVLPNGDIIIRRRHEDPFKKPAEETETDT